MYKTLNSLFLLLKKYNLFFFVNHLKVFSDLHSITLLGFGFLMTFLKRYGYSSVGFNLLLVAFAVQWALILRGWFEWNYDHNATFKIGLSK